MNLDLIQIIKSAQKSENVGEKSPTKNQQGEKIEGRIKGNRKSQKKRAGRSRRGERARERKRRTKKKQAKMRPVRFQFVSKNKKFQFVRATHSMRDKNDSFRDVWLHDFHIWYTVIIHRKRGPREDRDREREREK